MEQKMSVDNSGRFEIYGIVPSEHDDFNRDLDPEAQSLGGSTLIYTTDDAKEADKIMKEGGFIGSEGQYKAATWARDKQTGKTIGNAPS
jgi:hypothetical protein